MQLNKHSRWLSIPVMLGLIFAIMASPALADSRNAATWYNRAIAETDRLTDAQWEMLKQYSMDPAGPPTPELRELAARGQAIMSLLRSGSTRQYSDYQFDFEAGFELRIPHIQPLIWKFTPLLQVDALIRMEDGDGAGAADRMATLYRMPEHMGDDRIPLSTVVGDAMFRRTETIMQAALDRGALNAADANSLALTLRGFDASDPFNMVEALAMEKWVSVDWIAQKFTGETGGQDFAQYWLEISGEGVELPEAMLHMDRVMFDAELAHMDSYMDRVIGAFMMEDVEAGRALLEQLQTEAAAGEHGMLVEIFSWEYEVVFDRMIAAREAIATRLETLEQLASGQVQPVETANAAIWYLRGIEALEERDTDYLKAIQGFDAESTGETNDVPADIETIINTFRDGSQIKRCDFTVVRDPRQPELIPDYAAGLHDALRLLLHDAKRLLEGGETDAAVDRLCICQRMIGHLSRDDPIIVSLIAHRAFDESLTILNAAPAKDTLSDEHRARLSTAMLRIPRKDPFGYVLSVMSAKQHLPGLLAATFSDQTEKTEAALRERVAQWDGDRLLCVLAMLDVMKRAGRESSAGSSGERDPRSRLVNAVLPDVLSQVADQVATIAPALVQGHWSALDRLVVPQASRIGERMRQARPDLRRGTALLRPTADEAPGSQGP